MGEKLSDIIHLERHKRRETLKKIGNAIGCSPIYLSDIENGKRLPMDGEIVNRIAKYYGLDFEKLIKAT